MHDFRKIGEYLAEATKLLAAQRMPQGDYSRICDWLGKATAEYINGDAAKGHYLMQKAVRLLKLHTHIV